MRLPFRSSRPEIALEALSAQTAPAHGSRDSSRKHRILFAMANTLSVIFPEGKPRIRLAS